MIGIQYERPKWKVKGQHWPLEPNIYVSWSTSELRVRLAPLNRFKPSGKIFYWPFQGGTFFVDLLCFCSVLCLLCLCARLFICALWFTCWERADLLALVWGVCCEFVTFPLVSWVRCGTWLYRFLIFAPLLTSTDFKNRLFQNFPSYMKIYKEGNFILHHYLNIFWSPSPPIPHTRFQRHQPFDLETGFSDHILYIPV